MNESCPNYWGIFNLNFSIDYLDEVIDNLDNNFSGHDFDSSYFFDIEIDSCMHRVVIRIPEADDIDTTKTHVVVPENAFSHAKQVYGYYYVVGGIDSVLITEDNMDSVYLWTVGLASSCRSFDDWVSGPDLDIIRCVINGKCEPEFGENRANCADCANTSHGLAEHILIVKEIRTKTDENFHPNNNPTLPQQDYQEPHFQGKYELFFAYSIESNQGVLLHERNTFSTTGHTERPLIRKLSAWGNNCDVKRTRKKKNGNTKSNRGLNKTIAIEGDYDGLDTLDYNYHKNHIIKFILWEGDHNGEVFSESNGSTTLEWQMNKHGEPYTYNSGSGNSIRVIDQTNVPSDPQWQVVNGEEIMVVPLDGEMEIVFKLVP